MKSSILTIGNELLNGARSDTNSTFISSRLSERSIDVELILSVGDNRESIVKSMDIVLDDGCDFLFITGGLGPTHDDITKQVLSDYFKLDLVSIDRGSKKDIVDSQYQVIQGSKPIHNRLGTAIGIFYKYNRCKIFVLPGVPSEMRDMIDNIIIPNYLSFENDREFRVVRTIGISEKVLEKSFSKIIKKYSNNYQFAFLPSKGSVDFRIVEKEKTNIPINDIANFFYEKSQPNSFTIGDDPIELVLGECLRKKKITVAIAESCTGGLISKMLTDVPGCSDYFLGSLVCYSNESKITKLGIDRKIIDKYGAVSRVVAESMALAVKERFNADIGLAVTGISGPEGGSDDKPLGLVYISNATSKYSDITKYVIKSNRDSHRHAVAKRALNNMRILVESF